MNNQLTRREFSRIIALSGSGLTLGILFGIPSGASANRLAAPQGENNFSPSVFLSISTASVVTIHVPKSEMGQGIHTAAAMLIGEELGLDESRVVVETAPFNSTTSAKLGNQNTGGSTSIKDLWNPLRKAGATAREMLVGAAAKTWGVDRTECTVRQGTVRHALSGRSLSFGDLSAEAAKQEVPGDVQLKPSGNLSIIGTSKSRVEVRGIVTGSVQYGIDVDLPEMLYSVIARSPVYGGIVKSFDDMAVKSMPGIKAVVPVSSSAMGAKVRNGVAIVADSLWAALKGREALKVDWENGAGLEEDSGTISTRMREAASKDGRVMSKIGEPDQAFPEPTQRVESTYELPFLYHAQLEPMNCTARFKDGKCEIWGPLQFPEWAIGPIAQALGIKPADVTIHITQIGGGFGRRINFDYALEAAIVCKDLGVPVKVIWTREDDMRHGFFRPANLHNMVGLLDAGGSPLLWSHHIVSTTINVFGEGPNPSNECLGGGAGDFPYSVPNIKTMYSGVRSMITRGWWRSVEYSFNVFAMECFIDEMATAAKKDPVEFRLKLLESRPVFEVRHPFWGAKKSQPDRHAAVLRLAAEKTGWFAKRKPGHHLGVACLHHFGLDSFIAMVSDVSMVDGKVRVNKVTAAVDCGVVVNPLGLKAQIEGGMVMGLSAALGEAITIKKGEVEQTRLSQYKLLRIGQAPEIEVHIIQGSQSPGGSGELSTPVTAPSLCNALFSASGTRVRKLPITT